jgi:hypothetical protein
MIYEYLFGHKIYRIFDITSLADIFYNPEKKIVPLIAVFVNQTTSHLFLNFGPDQRFQFQNANITLNTWNTYTASYWEVRETLRNINNNINRSLFSCILKRCVMLPQLEIKVFCQTDFIIIEKIRKYIALVVSIPKQEHFSFILCDSDFFPSFCNKWLFVQLMAHWNINCKNNIREPFIEIKVTWLFCKAEMSLWRT